MESRKGLLFSRRIRNVGRLAQIANVFARHGFWSVADALGLDRWLTAEQLKTATEISRSSSEATNGTPLDLTDQSKPLDTAGLPTRLRRAFEELGPAFVKLGQVLATREDLLPQPYIDELSKLHAKVQSISFAAVQDVLDAELGSERLALFEKIESEPLAAGSIGQVHRATLRSGDEVVIKVQRPAIDSQLESDLAIMEMLAALLERYVPELRSLRPGLVIEEFARATMAEIDFVREAASTTKIAANFAGMDYVKIPEVYWGLSTQKVLTLSYLSGTPLSEFDKVREQGVDPGRLVDRGLQMFMQMVFVDGFFHGDLHPGNLLAFPDNTLGLLDFGVAVRIGQSTRERLAGLLAAFIKEDYEGVVHYFVELADPASDFDQDAFQHDVINAMAPFVGLKLSQMRTGPLLWTLAGIAAKRGAPMPRELILFLRTLVAFEGVGTKINPDFDMVATCARFTDKIVAEMYSLENLQRHGIIIGRDVINLLRFAPRQIRALLRASLAGDLALQVGSEDLRRVAVSLDRSSSRLAVSMIVGSLLIASSILVFARVGEEFLDVSLLGIIGFALAGIFGLYIVYSMISGRGGRF